MQPLIVSVSGVRGIIGESLTPEVAANFAAALGTHLQGGPVVLSRDGRPSGDMLRHAVIGGLLSVGCEVHDLGIAATPTCGLAIGRLKAKGGIQITASHNPAPWNGLKLFGGDGRVLSAEIGAQVAERFRNRDFRHVSWDRLPGMRECRHANKWHESRVLELIDVARIRGVLGSVFLDANGGAGGPLGRSLLHSLDCHPICHACDADGNFIHEPEPIEANVRAICPLVAQHSADVGFLLDPDSDRLAVIDEQGRYIGEERTLALAAWQVLSRTPGPLVINMSTSRVSEDVAKRFHSPCLRSAVGEANVADMMVRENAVLGGEGNGGVIDPRVGLVRDPFIGMGLILNLMADTERSLSDLVAELPTYAMIKDKCQMDPSRLHDAYQALRKKWPDAKVNDMDGLRLDLDRSWLHVRPSNTEPIVRIITESPTGEEARRIASEVQELIASL